MNEKRSSGSLDDSKISKFVAQRPTSLDLDDVAQRSASDGQVGQVDGKHTSSTEEEISLINTEGESPDTDDIVRQESKSPDTDDSGRPERKSHRIAESLKSRIRDLSPSRPHSPNSSPKLKPKHDKKPKKDLSRAPKSPSAWLPASINQMFSNKNKSEDFKRLFKDLPDSEQLIVDYSCALQRDILVHGRLYLSHNWLCFYANIFGWETIETLKFNEISSITKEKTALVIPNAIQISTQSEKYFFASFISRDTTYTALFKVWQNALLDQPLSAMELIQMIGKYSDSRPDLSSENDSDDEKDTSERFSNDSESDYSSNRPDDGVSCSDSEPVQSPSQTVISGPKNFDVYPNEDGLDEDMTAPEVSVTPPTPTKTIIQDPPLKNNQPLVNLKADNQSRARNHSLSPKLDRAANNNVRTGSRGRSASQQNIKESSDDNDEEGTASDESHSEGPHHCFCEQHFSNEMLNEEFPISVDTLYEYIFTEHDFFKKVQRMRKIQDLVFHPWTKTENGRRRVIRYTVALNYSIGPKSSQTTEIQTCVKGSVPGRVYVIEAEVTNEGIPYGDTFNVLNKYCLMSLTSKSSRLRITSEVHFKKSVWGFVKTMIEKNSTEALQEYFNLLGSSLRKEAEGGSVRRPLRRRKSSPSGRRHKRNRSLKENISTKTVIETTPEPKDARVNVEPSKSRMLLSHLKQRFPLEGIKVEHTFVIVVSFILFMLLLTNLFLVYRLISLENAYQRNYGWTVDSKNLPADAKEWTKLLQQQSDLHKVERLRFQQILDSSVGLMNQVQAMLTELQTELDRSKLREFPSVADFPQAARK